MSGKSYVGTMGFIFECLTEIDFFYPEDLDSGEFLKYYASKFNCVTLRGFDEKLPYKWYSYLIDQVSDNPDFKFIMQLPHQFTHINIKFGLQLWDDFWNGCKQLHERNRLGCLVVLFNTKFICNEKNIKKLEKICKRIPSDVRVAFEFAHWTWWESQCLRLFINNPNWVMASPFLENGIVDAGWAGTIPSTRIRSRKNLVPISVSNDFAYITLNGTLGKSIGSYDEHYFLEELAVKIRNLEKEGVSVFLTFNNTNSSHSSPLPPLLVSGYLCHPQLKILHNLERDMPCCLHDANRLTEIIKMQNRSKYKIGLNGYVEVKLEKC